MLFCLLRDPTGIEKIRAQYPTLPDDFWPPRIALESHDEGVAPHFDAETGERITAGIYPNDDDRCSRRIAFVANAKRSAFAILMHTWPFRTGTVFIYALAAETSEDLAELFVYLRTFVDRSGDFCAGILLNASSVVYPPPDASVPAVFQRFSLHA